MDQHPGMAEHGAPVAADFSFAFQPIVDLSVHRVAYYEALVRGPAGQPAATILDGLDENTSGDFDKAACVKAIACAKTLFTDPYTRLSINLMPWNVSDPLRALNTIVAAAAATDFPLSQIMFEVSEHQRVADADHLAQTVEDYGAEGLGIAIDAFGAGFGGLTPLARFKPHVVKLDAALVKGIDGAPDRQAIVNGILVAARQLGIKVVAVGVEKPAELAFLFGAGVRLVQGYLIAHPAFEALPDVNFDALSNLACGKPPSSSTAATTWEDDLDALTSFTSGTNRKGAVAH